MTLPGSPATVDAVPESPRSPEVRAALLAAAALLEAGDRDRRLAADAARTGWVGPARDRFDATRSRLDRRAGALGEAARRLAAAS